MRVLVAVALICLSSSAARADDGVRVVDARGRSAVQARVGERVELRVEWRGRRLPDGARVRFRRVRPHMQHRDTPPPNEGIAQYSNSVLFGPDHGRWIGLDAVEYVTAEDLAGSSLDRSPDRADGAGTVWITAEVTLPDGRSLRAPDHDDRDRLGLRASVMRVSFRTDDTFVGWLSTYFGVPNIFGSVRAQPERYIGADCADVLIGAARARGDRRLRYTSVTGIHRYARPVGPELSLHADGRITDADGRTVELRWGEDVKPGDFVAIDYAHPNSQLPRAWDHIGALVRDTDADGLLSPADTLRHMAPTGLSDHPLTTQSPARLRLHRLR